MSLFENLIFSVQYIPHGHCYLWQTPLVGLHVVSDGLIALAYYSIPIALVYFVRRVDDLPFKNIFLLFGVFILSCGTVHVIEIWTLWHPDYWIFGFFKAVTALISLYTALSLIPILPQALKLPSPQHLSILNQQLNRQIEAKNAIEQQLNQLNQELEQRVSEKTTALVKANKALKDSVRFKEKITDATPNILYIFDLKEQRNVYCNPFIKELLGYTPKELKKFEDGIVEELIHPDDIDRLRQHFAKCLSLHDDECLEIEYRIRNTAGQWHWLHDKNTVFCREDTGQPRQILGIASDITQNKQNELHTERLNDKLEEKIGVLEKTNLARVQLGKMNEYIQACDSLDEARVVISDLLKPLFPNTSGDICLINESKNYLETIASWGESFSEPHFDPKDCWALRRGNSHVAYPQTPGLYCPHVNESGYAYTSLCLPMIAKGETLGVLHLQFDSDEAIESSLQNIAETVAQNIAMSIANLRLQQQLRHQSLRDPLTGLYNRRYLEESLAREIDRARRKQQSIGLLMLDVDHFKRFNDIYGHSAGDSVLSCVGSFLLSNVRQYDIPCRYGGEEFVIVMPDAKVEDAVVRAEKIRQGIKALEPKQNQKKLEPISVSIGVSHFPDDSTDVKGLLQTADKALYQAKKQGRDRVIRWEFKNQLLAYPR